ncbi:non-ribosomal peptide synthetase [Acanthopleuribacter pedis]|uniref:Amino acid adenylation domain-containing protein n=1 Tax=Acanthopleuribacter pedis TaxID=442870 RepID=A0A8J7QHX0_9BACT|nr:non-ribosomal peptide synthetase [Acanthopleuribacter pedis]MBO1322740.1 amino acid adenylation domain-containing protein [Acanthopleuribacter pedis]
MNSTLTEPIESEQEVPVVLSPPPGLPPGETVEQVTLVLDRQQPCFFEAPLETALAALCLRTLTLLNGGETPPILWQIGASFHLLPGDARDQEALTAALQNPCLDPPAANVVIGSAPTAPVSAACLITFFADPQTVTLTVTAAPELGAGFAALLTRYLHHGAACPSDTRGNVLLPAADRRLLLETWQPKTPEPHRCKPLHEQFSAWAALFPDHPAVQSRDLSWSYGLLDQQSNFLACILRETLDVQTGDLVAVYPDRRAYLPLQLLATLKAGGVYLPLDPEAPQQRLAFMLSDAAPKVVLCYGRPPGVIEDCDAKVVRLDRLVWHGQHRGSNAPCTGRDLAYTIYTSGSTGHPKAVQVQHDQFDSMIHAQIAGFGVHQESRVLQMASPAFDASLSELFLALLSGAALVIAESADVANHGRLRKLIADFAVTHATFPPAYLHELSDAALEPLQTIITAGEAPIQEDSLRWAQSKRVINAYGPTETAVCAAFFTVPADFDPGQTLPIGRPLPHLRMYIVDEQGDLLPPGVVGELCIAGRGVARGYLHRPELQARKFSADPFHPGETWYRSGDLAYQRADGLFVFVGRRDDQVKINGYRVELGEIKGQLERRPAVDEALVVVARNQQERGALIAYIVLKKGQRLNAENHPRRQLAKVLPQHMLPHHFIVLDQFPRNSSGKIDRKALPHVTRGGDTPYLAPRTEVERLLVKLWQAVLDQTNIGVNDHFFELGGDSLTAIHFISSLPESIHGFTIADLFHFPVLKELAAEIEKQQPTWNPAAEPAKPQRLHDTRFLLNPHQRDLLADGAKKAGLVIAVTRPLLKPDPSLLEQAATYVQQQHPGLARVFDDRERARLCQAPARIHLLPATDEDPRFAVQQAFDHEQLPLWAIYLIGDSHLAIAATPLLCDEQDMLVLRRDLEQAYRDLAAERPVHFAQNPPNPLLVLDRYQAPAARISIPSPPALPTESVTFGHTWTRSQTRGLLIGAGKPFRCRAVELVAAALAQLAHAEPGWGLPHLVWLRDAVRRVTAGPDYSHAVAGHTRLVALPLPHHGDDWPAWIRATKENNRRRESWPTRLHQDQAAIHLIWCDRLDTDLPEQNLLGELDGSPSRVGTRFNSARFPLSLRFWVWQGQLHLRGTLNWETIRCDGTVFAQRLAAGIDAMVERCCSRKTTWPTPSDFGITHLDLATFDSLLAAQQVDAGEVADLTTTSAWQSSILRDEADAGKPCYLRQHSFRLRGKLEIDAAERAWTGLTQRHAVLRTAFLVPTDGPALQWTRKRFNPPLRWVDLSHYRDAEQIERAQEQKRRQRDQAQRETLLDIMFLRYGRDDHEMVLWLHPLLGDTRSMQHLLDEWLISYQAFLDGEAPKLSHRPPFRDYTHWLHDRNREGALAFWQDYLNETEPQLLSAPEPEAPLHRRFTITWPETLVSRLRHWSTQRGLSMNAALKALWGLSLARQGQRPDPVFGTTLSGRPEALGEAQTMLGLFQVLVPWCMHLDREHDFAELVRHTQNLTAEMERLTPLPLEQITPDQAMFDHILLLEPAWQPPDVVPTLTMTPHYQFEHYPFALNTFVTIGAEIQWRLAFDHHRIQEDMVHSLVSSCESILLRILDEGEASLSDLGLVPKQG